MNSIALVSLDFDGTIVDHSAPGGRFVSDDFLEIMNQLKREGARFLINTGRTLDHLEEGVAEFGVEIAPDFAVTNEREVFYRCDRSERWESLDGWNQVCLERHEELYRDCRVLFERMHDHVSRDTRAQSVFKGSHLEGFVATSHEEMEEILIFVNQTLSDAPLIRYQRNDVYMRFCHVDYDKGTALSELARHLGVDPSRIFAAGDNHNDLPMLNGRHAGMVACPDNAVLEVKETVRNAAGYLASATCSSGVAEALRHFLRPRR